MQKVYSAMKNSITCIFTLLFWFTAVICWIFLRTDIIEILIASYPAIVFYIRKKTSSWVIVAEKWTLKRSGMRISEILAWTPVAILAWNSSQDLLGTVLTTFLALISYFAMASETYNSQKLV